MCCSVALGRIGSERGRLLRFSMDGIALKMAVNPITNLDKAAILLRRLPQPSLVKVLDMVGPENSVRLRFAIDEVSKRPDLAELDEQILQEFRDMQREVRESLRGSPQLERIHEIGSVPAASDHVNGDSSPDNLSTATTPEGLAIAELMNVPPAVLAIALLRETPRSMALVLRQLPTEFSGKVLEQLPAEQRQKIFMLLAAKVNIHPAVTQSVLQAVCNVCRTIDPSQVGEEDSRFKTLIGILQMVERDERMRLMEALTEQDEELAAQIDDNLYDYTDLMRIQDRSVQKLLTQLELKVVAIALKTAPPEILDKVMKNLSERVRAALTEEIGLLNSVSNSKVEQARREIANVIRLQDKDGTLQWIE